MTGTVLRVLVAIIVTLAAMAFVFGFFPGIEVYRRESFVETRAVIEHWNWFLGILVLLLVPGAVVWTRPRIAYALLWSMWTIGLSMVVFLATFDLGEPGAWTTRTVALWPHAVFGLLMFAVLFLIIAVVPIACAVLWWITRERPVTITLPTARVIRY